MLHHPHDTGGEEGADITGPSGYPGVGSAQAAGPAPGTGGVAVTAARAILGGYTTFSTYMLDTRSLLVTGHAAIAGPYLSGSLAAGLTAV